MTETLLAVVGGIAAHQSDKFIRLFPQPWQTFCRYVIGVLAIFVFYLAALRRMNQQAQREGALAFLAASVGVGVGVVLGHFLDVLRIE